MHGMKSQMELADEEFRINLAKALANDVTASKEYKKKRKAAAERLMKAEREVQAARRNPSAMREALEGIIENLSTRIELKRGNRVTMPVGEAKCLVGYARAAIAATPEPPSDADALREALESCLIFIMRLDRAFNPFMQNLLENAIAKASAALAVPPNDLLMKAEEEVQAARKAYKEICEGD